MKHTRKKLIPLGTLFGLITSTLQAGSIINSGQLPTDARNFDVIIVGAGNAGCVLANRLTENPNLRVLLIDVGRDDTRQTPLLPPPAPPPLPSLDTNPWPSYQRGALITVPYQWNQSFDKLDWTPLLDNTSDSRYIWYPRASTLGGCTTHNYTIALRGSNTVYDAWAALGNTLWSYNEVLPYFKKYENRSQTQPTGAVYYDPALPSTQVGSFSTSLDGLSGPIQLLWPNVEDSLAAAFKASALAILGLPPNVNFDNPASEIGISMQDLTQYDQYGTRYNLINPYPTPYTFPPNYPTAQLASTTPRLARCAAQMGYIYPIINDRPNLTILQESLVTKVLFIGKTAVGVEFLPGWNNYQTGRSINTIAGQGGTTTDAAANAEEAMELQDSFGLQNVIFASKGVILSGGTYNSPQLLMLSGVGDPAQLRPLGIKVVHNLPGVGQNLQDHPEVFLVWNTLAPLTTLFGMTPPNQGLYFGGTPESMLMTMRFKSNPSLASYDFHAHLFGYAPTTPDGAYVLAPPEYFPLASQTAQLLASQIAAAPGEPNSIVFQLFHASSLFEHVGNLQSRGYLQLQSSNPTVPPKIVMNLLNDPADMASFISALTTQMKPFVENLAGAGYFGGWYTPSDNDWSSTANITEWIRNNVWGHHVCGTCKMGPSTDPMAVIDQRGHVHGISNLWVCDASITPIAPSANTATPVYMIAERMADLIKQDLNQ